MELGYSGHVPLWHLWGQVRVFWALQRPAQDLLVIWSQLHGLAGELCIKVVQAIVVCDLGLEGRQGLLLFQLRTLTRGCQMGGEHPSARFSSLYAHKSQNKMGSSAFQHASYLNAIFFLPLKAQNLGENIQCQEKSTSVKK